jgi:cytokine receptor domeless
VKTRMRRPDNPPAIDKGSFNIGPGGDVYIYWKHLPKCYQNGGEYGYTVSSSDLKNDAPNELLPHLAIYTKDRINLMKDTTITIRNHNQEGVSKNVSMLTIPGNERKLDGPTKIKKILSNGSYQLSWSPPDSHRDTITSYTVFWCVSKSELPNSCEGSINFERRSPFQTYFNFESNQTVNFAVSANSETSTSGMIWARCTTANSNEIGKIKTIWIPRLASKEIEVEWKLECTDSGIVAGYQLEYCPSEKPRTLECKETAKKINITGGLDNPKHTLTNLSPYTTYKIIIRMFSNSTMGPASDPLANTTLEAGKLKLL